MQTLTHLLLENSLENQFINNRQLERIIKGSRQKRYHLVDRAIKAGELVRIKQGLYFVNNKFSSLKHHPFTYAQAISPGSYVSLESALSYHGWIPEAVTTVTSIIPTRKSSELSIGNNLSFSFSPLAINPGFFLELVHRVKLTQHRVLIASPLRALFDLVCLKKIKWQGIQWLEQSLRIDIDTLYSIKPVELNKLKLVYKHHQVLEFIEQLNNEINSVTK